MDRKDIYYWKCDRAAAFHGTSDYEHDQTALMASLERTLGARFGTDVSGLAVSCGQGNHRTFAAKLAGRDVFIRTEDGVERDDYLAVEAAVTRRVAACGVPVPETIAFDCSRSCGFAWQIIPLLPFRDLNAFVKDGTIVWDGIAATIGAAVARWQEVTADGFGPFSAETALASGNLRALHPTYEAYYRLNLQRHLSFLCSNAFIDETYAARILAAIDRRAASLKLERGVLVHKDLAVWNILGTATEAKSFIDWDDCILGDAMDDLSLMGVTAEGPETRQIVSAYAKVRALAPDAAPRFWLCWLRNMIFKSVIRVGAGYFRKDGDGFFLIGAGKNGNDLEAVTRRKIEQALVALEKGQDLDAI